MKFNMLLTSASKRSANFLSILPVYDFLAPSFVHFSRAPRSIRALNTSKRCFAARDTERTSPTHLPKAPKSGHDAASHPATLNKCLTQAQRDFLTSALRVNQAGELAATLIYTAQTPPIVNSHPHLRPLMKHMYDQEASHFNTFNPLLAKHRIRPTAMYPVWTLAASALGWGTAIMGREAAMACTEAVETEIGGHYNGQVRALLDMSEKMENSGQEVGDELKELTNTIREIRDQELEHLDHAVENNAKEAKPYELLTGVIRAGCRGAIWVSERV